ncbi:MAG: S1 RNA-binding domain-containing protein [Bacilli bacterium]|nr:S1 RNA-binding domain-containing protein [Bacilli bacterium]
MNNYDLNSVVTGKVSGIEDYGIFLLLDDGTTGLIHISEISDSYVREVGDYAKLGQKITAKVIGFDETHQKLKLSLKMLTNEEKGAKKIKETPSGFSNLGKSLEKWIKALEEQSVEK